MRLDNELTPTSPGAADDGLPGVHLPTLLRAAWRLRRWVVLGVVLAGIAGLVAGYGMGTRIYESSTLLLYRPAFTGDNGSNDDLDLTTQLHLVKLPDALAEVRERVGRPISLEALGGAIRVEQQGRTDLVQISVRDDDRERAAELANTARDVFLDRQRSEGIDETSRRIEAITARLGTLRRELEVADSILQDYSQTNRIVDLDKEAQWYLEELTAVNLLYEDALSKQQSNQLQRESIDGVIDEIRASIEEEATSLEGLGTLNIRIERLRDAIADDQRQRAMNAELAQRELDLRRARVLVEQGVWSEARLQEAQNAYDRQLAYTADTDQIEIWREELVELQNQVIPDQGSSPSEPLLKDVMLRKFDIELEGVTLEQRVEHLRGAQRRVQARLDSIPLLERGYFARLREVSVREKVLEDLEKDLAAAQTALESDHVSFSIVADARPPVFPLDSNRRILFALTVFGILGIVLFALAARVLLDPTLRSLAEARIRTEVPFTADLPMLRHPEMALESDRGLRERFERIARRLRLRAPREGALVLVASPRDGSGTGWVARGLAGALGRQDERVLLLETRGGRSQVAPEAVAGRREPLADEFSEAAMRLRRVVEQGAARVEAKLNPRRRARVRRYRRRIQSVAERVAGPLRTLRRVPSRGVDGPQIAPDPSTLGFSAVVGLRADLEEVGSFVRDRGVLRVTGGGEIESGLLRSRALDRVLDEARRRYDIVLIHTPPILSSPHALHLADRADGLVLVAGAEETRAADLRRAGDDLQDTGIRPLVGVLNRVHLEFLEVA